VKGERLGEEEENTNQQRAPRTVNEGPRQQPTAEPILATSLRIKVPLPSVQSNNEEKKKNEGRRRCYGQCDSYYSIHRLQLTSKSRGLGAASDSVRVSAWGVGCSCTVTAREEGAVALSVLMLTVTVVTPPAWLVKS
jgi:hypothetical protein